MKTPLRLATLFDSKPSSKTIDSREKGKINSDKLEKPSNSNSVGSGMPLSPKTSFYSSAPISPSSSSKSPTPFISRAVSNKSEQGDLRSSLQLLHQNGTINAFKFTELNNYLNSGNSEKIQRVTDVLYSLTLKKKSFTTNKLPASRKKYSDTALDNLADSVLY